MKCKAFEIAIELEIQAITCPGVWLCPNGKITLQVYIFGTCIRTSGMKPIFPLLCHEKFTFRKILTDVRKLDDLERVLQNEYVFMELIQWEDCTNANVLATFKSTLFDLLYPLPAGCKGVLAGIDIDLLMESTKRFPGIISPKIEISTKTTIEEVLRTFRKDKRNNVVVVNPKLISSKSVPKRRVPLRQKKVCHTFAYHKAKAFSKPRRDIPVVSKRKCICSVETKSSDPIVCKCEKEYSIRKSSTRSADESIRDCISTAPPGCTCTERKKIVLCPLCTKYKHYFEQCTCRSRKDLCPCQQRNGNRRSTSNKILELTNSKLVDDPDHINLMKATLANKIHDRLEKTLNSKSDSNKPNGNNVRNSSQLSHTDQFYKSLEQFYKQLYRKTYSNDSVNKN